MLNNIHLWLTANLPTITIVLAVIGLLALLIVWLLFCTWMAIRIYNHVLRNWSPAGWYYSMCMMISDMVRKDVPWQEFHVQKVGMLLAGLRKQNPEWFFSLMRALEVQLGEMKKAKV
jgi:hypothetical protein